MVMHPEAGELLRAWEAAADRALLAQAYGQEVRDGLLNTAAGLNIQSGLQAGGLWGSTGQSCGGTCGQLSCTPC
jgi:hypothetical protein